MKQIVDTTTSKLMQFEENRHPVYLQICQISVDVCIYIYICVCVCTLMLHYVPDSKQTFDFMFFTFLLIWCVKTELLMFSISLLPLPRESGLHSGRDERSIPRSLSSLDRLSARKAGRPHIYPCFVGQVEEAGRFGEIDRVQAFQGR